ncbi:AI-2E family transporter [Loktanella sp. S4079]|uniref:AI-2E family transporter n=1 Tax=Loktanella sp. S4079 TaxID=579483 RepID=UPI0005FA4D8F|nr:AI-2E family transporter [Loktanella sp. S4079]
MDETHKIKNLLFGIFLLLLFGAIYFARDMLLPIVLGILVSLTLSPIVRGLRRLGIPEVISASLLIFSATLICGVGIYALSGPASDIIERAPEVGAELRRKFGFLLDSLAAVQDASDEMENITNGGNSAPEVAIQQPGLLTFAAGGVASFLSLGFVGLILALFILSSGNLFYLKLVKALPSFSDKKLAVKTVRAVEHKLSHYLLTIVLINIGLGVCISVALHAVGFPQAVVWGAAASLLNFLPFVGAMFGFLAIGAYSIIVYETLTSGLIAPVVYLSLTSIEAQFITPALLGRRLELNTVSVFLAVIIWSWLWSIPGALMAVPLLVVTKVICDNVAPLNAFGDFLGPGRNQTLSNPK